MNKRQKIERITQEYLDDLNNIKSPDTDIYWFDKMVDETVIKSSKIIKSDELTVKMYVFAYVFYLAEKGITLSQIINQKKLQKLFIPSLERFIKDYHKELSRCGLMELMADKDITHFHTDFMTQEDFENIKKIGVILDNVFESKKLSEKQWYEEVQENLLSEIRNIIKEHN